MAPFEAAFSATLEMSSRCNRLSARSSAISVNKGMGVTEIMPAAYRHARVRVLKKTAVFAACLARHIQVVAPRAAI
jgi:hypothetical protein